MERAQVTKQVSRHKLLAAVGSLANAARDMAGSLPSGEMKRRRAQVDVYEGMLKAVIRGAGLPQEVTFEIGEDMDGLHGDEA